MTRIPTIAATFLLAGGLLAAFPGAAAADPDVGARGEAFQHGRTAGVRLTNSTIVLSGNGLGGKSDGYRIPRPCWYEPSKTAEEMLDMVRSTHELWLSMRPSHAANEPDIDMRKYEDKIGQKGKWWQSAYDENDPNGLACASEMNEYVWVPEGSAPAGAITMEQLMQIARAALTVPEPKIKLSPDAKSYVNLPTWVWLDGTGQTSRSVTATLPGVMSATVTATPGSLKIDPGTTSDRAEVRTDCGTSGQRYAADAKEEDFRCGVRYLRASIDQPRQVYQLTVTSVWNVTGTGTGGATFPFDPVQVSATRDVPVGEIQSIVTGR